MCENSLKNLYSIFIVFFVLPIRAWHCDLIFLEQMLQFDSRIQHHQCFEEIPFEYKKLPFERDYLLHPYQGKFLKSYITTIPQGRVIGCDGYVIFDKKLVYDFVWQNCFVLHSIWDNFQEKSIFQLNASVVVLAQSGYQYYYHWLIEVLGRLALLEIENIHYDYLYVAYNKGFIKQTLDLWGIDSSKIIEASDEYILQAKNLIVPSLVARAKTNGVPRLTHYIPEYIVTYIKNKLLDGYKKKQHDFNFAKKIFISREDAASRKMLNEQDVFTYFEQYGFKKYVLGSMSIIEQIALFQGADIIIGSLGSGMSNVIFCKSDVKIFDIFQRRCDCTIFYLCQTLGLEYHPIKTMDFIDENDGQYDAVVPLESLEEILQYL
ncbi:glycosyltransferase family 61 protein [Candidatus Dependentiae bacterium]|nr:glycosyltransferase family 61 protein [Candidatus Dependentiae bacterium]